MAKNDAFKLRLKQAAKRRESRLAAMSKQTGDAGNSGEDLQSPDAAKSTRNAAVDVLVNEILHFDRDLQAVDDRDILDALRALQRGYASSEPKRAALYQALVSAREQSQISSHAARRAVEELIDLVKMYDLEARSPRAAITYLRSISE